MMNPFLHELVQLLNEQELDRHKWLNSLNIVPNTEDKRYKRKEKIRRLKRLGVQTLNSDSTLFTGPRSPNCSRCNRGELGPCIALTYECNKRCFFCYRYENRDHPVQYDYDALVAHIAKNGFKGVAITGGEPLLKYKDLCTYLAKLKPLGLHIHLYSNASLLTAERIKSLNRLGLSEIRFNLASRNYRLIPEVIQSKKYMRYTTIKIPVIPEHVNRVKALLVQLDALRCITVNLNELVVHPQNIRLFKRRKYYLKGETEIPFYEESASPIFGSEEMALELIEFALTTLKHVSVHYCSYRAKAVYQQNTSRLRAAAEQQLPFETINKYGLLQRLLIYEPDVSQAVEDLTKKRVSTRLFKKDSDGLGRKILYASPTCLKHLRRDRYGVGLLSLHPLYAPELAWLYMVSDNLTAG